MTLKHTQPERVEDATIHERLAEAEKLLNEGKVKLPEDVLKRATEGIKEISRKQADGEQIFASDFNFVEEIREAVQMGIQYDETMENLKGGDLYNPEKPVEGDKKAPTQEEVIYALMTKLTPDQKEVIAQMKNPVLLVKPITTWKRFAGNLNSVKQIGTNNRELEWTENEEDVGITNNITCWEVGFAEGEQELDGKPGILGDLINEWQEGPIAKKGAKLVTNNEYMLLMAKSVKKGAPIDEVKWSVLRGEVREQVIGKDGRVSFGRGIDDAPYFSGIYPGDLYNYARFRYAVMVKI